MEFSASFDSMAILLTTGVFALFVILFYWNIKSWRKMKGDSPRTWIRVTVFMLLVFTIGYSYLYHPQKYFVKGGKLIIKRPWKDVEIKMSDILDCRMLEESDMHGTIRTFGVGGLFGYFGNYHNPMIGDMTFYTTQQKNLVLVHATEGRSIILSPDKPKEFAGEITTDITPNN